AHHGSITAREALQYSCNDALAQMSEKINTEEFLTYLREFGFGERTNVGLPSETRGSIKTTSDRLWSIRSKMTMSIGQELSVSALQMVQAATALANDGVPLQLSLISRITDKDGAVLYEHEPTFKNPVVSKSTADYLLSCMETTARQGTGTRAYLGDISIGVKTGTAQMIDAETGGYSDTDFVSNVAAVFPVDDPEIVLYIVITKAKGETYSGRIVAPVIAEAANVIIDHLGLARANAASLEHSGRISFQTEQTPTVGSVLPDFTGLSKRLLTPLLTDENIRYLIEGDGWVTSQNPPAGTAVTEGMTVELYLE
ncbi:MAG: penicillin-binding transpeptidase domain-containing protein, partial [Spirochaetales bacterium]